MKCPACKETTLTISERQGIEIDYCPDCRGIWLDRGELDKLLEKARGDERDRPQRHGSHDHRDSSHYDPRHKPYKRKKSLLEELFD